MHHVPSLHQVDGSHYLAVSVEGVMVKQETSQFGTQFVLDVSHQGTDGRGECEYG